MRILIAVVLVAARLAAQGPPVRQIGRLERVTTEPLASVANAIQLPGGRVLANDITARRLLLFDSALASAIVIADTTSATSGAYGRQAGTLVRYRGDTSIFIDIAGLSMLVIDPGGKIVRVKAVPNPDYAQQLIGSVFGLPGFDAQGRLIYHAPAGFEGTFMLCCVEHPGRIGDGSQRSRPVPKPDSGLLVRVDLGTRAADTLTSIKIEWEKQRILLDEQGYVQSIERVRMPCPDVDAWAVLSDGSLAVVRGRDFHADWLGADGRWTSTTKIPFAWRRLDEARKLAIIDSSAKVEQEIAQRLNARSSAGGSGRGSSGRGGGGAGGGREGTPIPEVAGRADPSDIPDYERPFDEGSAIADADGDLWIRTTTVADGRPVYDVVNRHGDLIDRVQLPAFRTIAGFGPGVVYMAVKDPTSAVHLERARIH
jgi:hypothetical protein